MRVQLRALTGDQAFAEEFPKTRPEARGVRLARPDADLTMPFFAAALAVDTAETFLAIPAAYQVPVLAVPLPEIALFKWERSQGPSCSSTRTIATGASSPGSPTPSARPGGTGSRSRS